MKKIIFSILTCTAVFLPKILHAQILTVSPGTDMTIKPGTVFSADSLVLIPSADFTISNTTLNKSAIVTHALPNPHIARVYQFDNTSKPFSGSIQINYLDAELKGIAENLLELNVHNGTAWKAFAPANRDAVNNFVLTASLNCIPLNELTLAAECAPPKIQCPANIVVNANPNRCDATVQFDLPVVTDACGNASLAQIAGLGSGAAFPVGCTINRFVATGPTGKTDTCSFSVTVKDITPPNITGIKPTPDVLWPANHQMTAVTVNYNSWDNCGSVSSSLSVTSNEPVSGTGNGDTAPDWIVLDNHHLQLRAERSGNGNGRTYTISISSTDASGNTTIEKTKVLVPHDKNGHDGDEDHHHHFDCKILPNPSSHYFTIEVSSNSAEKVEAVLLDLNGRRISKLNTVKNSTLRFGEDLRPGVYMVQITQGDQQKIMKVIKQ
ncbi:HYR domain-containing protein [Ferruginibacter paludis]|uniref:HYR domain-containing protein n=1 Tax=Ferruginibacter paludis TaxID=1310417 RepID=UPI0025B5C1D5|nr:HYR domain-containing protein [Ferruginibacter paludis]MDN3654294.1 HYR domain-containing protein [Ferruginibacter paludis]